MSDHQEPAEVDVPGFTEKAFLVSASGVAHRGAVLFLHWFDEAPNANRTQFLDEANELARLGVTSLLPQLMFPWASAPHDAETDLRRIEEEASALRAALELLREAARIDSSPIAIVGHDFGAMHGAVLASGSDPACVVLIAPTPRWSDWFLRFWPVEGDRFDYMRTLDPVDPITAIGRVSAPILFQFGRQDFYIAAMTGSELFEAAGELKTMKAYDADHGMELPTVRTDRLEFLAEHLGLEREKGA
jgi:pimeloyl-ACP methyl ester carboxylesterase